MINEDKCEFCVSEVTYLGYKLDQSGLYPDNIKELRKFLGMKWYARFIKNESEMKIPLARLLRGTQMNKILKQWEWGEEQEEAFEMLKRPLAETPVLARPDFTKIITIQSDASNFAIGAVLTQEEEGEEHPIVYASRVLSQAEKNYTTT